MDNVTSLTKFLGIDPDSALGVSIEGTMDHIPLVGKILSSLKMRELQKKIKYLELRIQRLSDSMMERPDDFVSQFFKERAFPFMLDQLLEEQQEEKTDLIMNGIEYIYDQKITEENKVLIHFDILKQLRVTEIKHLMTYSSEGKQAARRASEYEEVPGSDVKYYEYIENHLEKLGLIDKGVRSTSEVQQSIVSAFSNVVSTKGGMKGRGLTLTNTQIVLTPFGREFIKFFDLKSLIQLPAK
ncbi:hypothetical protein [Paenibacillus sp. OK003]|uniref:hypothetical protein n=1 Tax=Paenibacillus sp. OK003 TaxID=1884380 RepID=UPI0008CF54D7|nr:hypothetical protein [Paenibacillus sp. OK003]SEL29705.1 hypothetical protein SAMN05518856_109191 [Paenibacillus sp. OK003]